MTETAADSVTPTVSLVSGDTTTLLTDDYRISVVTATLLNAPDGEAERLTVDRTRVPSGVDVSGIQVGVFEVSQ